MNAVASTVHDHMSNRPPYRCNGCRGWLQTICLVLFSGLALGALIGCSGSGVQAGAPGGSPGKGGRGGRGGDVPVTVAKAKQKNVPVEVQVIGNVEAYSTISVKAQVTGQLTNVYFKEGDFVKKGDKLF